nr:MAG: major capsid protein [Microvirus sp.]
MNKVFQNVGGASVRRSMFDLDYSKLLTGDMGRLYPVMCDEVVPGDFLKISNEVVMRFNPLLAPILHRIDLCVHYFFVPYRILDENWEDFITGGADGDNAYELPRFSGGAPGAYAKGSLWDYFGFPLGDGIRGGAQFGLLPLKYPWDAYTKIWNEFYRDQNLQDAVTIFGTPAYRNWEKDYFTSALPFQQRGTSPALPISGTTYADFDFSSVGRSPFIVNSSSPEPNTDIQLNTSGAAALFMANHGTSLSAWNTKAENVLNQNTVDLSAATTFNVNDLRLAFQVQKWLERNARAGVRYTEFLKSHFGVNPRDDRLQRPEYIGGTKNPVIISEVLQTSSTDATSPQGNLAGHAISVQSGYAGKYHVQEYGLIMGLMSVMPKPMYMQGMNRQWLRETRYDFYFPEFANLSEQAILEAEIYAAPDQTEAGAKSVFGFQGRYDEMRVKQNLVTGDFRDTFSYWHLGRSFASPPLLNSSFISCNPRKDILAVPTEPAFLCNFGNVIKAFRPLPVIAEPGFIDH